MLIRLAQLTWQIPKNVERFCPNPACPIVSRQGIGTLISLYTQRQSIKVGTPWSRECMCVCIFFARPFVIHGPICLADNIVLQILSNWQQYVDSDTVYTLCTQTHVRIAVNLHLALDISMWQKILDCYVQEMSKFRILQYTQLLSTDVYPCVSPSVGLGYLCTCDRWFRWECSKTAS